MGDPHGTALHDEKDGSVHFLLDTERLSKTCCLSKISCEQMPLQLFYTCFALSSCIEQLTGHEVHRFITHVCQDASGNPYT